MERRQELIWLGGRVKAERIKIGMSQVEFANRIGKDKQSINRVENGRINPSFTYLLDICNGLEISLSELFSD